jgi:hypothetical protein
MGVVEGARHSPEPTGRHQDTARRQKSVTKNGNAGSSRRRKPLPVTCIRARVFE